MPASHLEAQIRRGGEYVLSYDECKRSSGQVQDLCYQAPDREHLSVGKGPYATTCQLQI